MNSLFIGQGRLASNILLLFTHVNIIMDMALVYRKYYFYLSVITWSAFNFVQCINKPTPRRVRVANC